MSQARAVVQAGRPSARKALRLGVCHAVARSGPSPTSPASRPIGGHRPGVEHVVTDAHADPTASGSSAVLKTP